MNKITVLNKEIELYTQNESDYICLTDIARYKDPSRSDYIIQNWLKNRNVIEFIGLWETINNPNFNPIEFDGFRKQAGLNSFILTAKEWRDKNPQLDGNMCDYADVSQLICLSNLENLNALFIKENLEKAQRLEKLNTIAIEQMTLLTTDLKTVKAIEKIEKKDVRF